MSEREYEQAIENLDLPRTYRIIFVTSSTFQLVTDRSDAREALRRFYDHLVPGGRLVMSFMVFRPHDGALDEQEWALIGEKVRPEDGLLLRRWWRGTYDVATQLQHTDERFELLDGDKLVTEEYQRRSPATRGYRLDQAVAHLAGAGFADVHAVSGYSTEPAGPEDGTFCVFGTAGILPA